MPDLKKIRGFASVGIADIIGTGITAFFWFFIATLMNPEEYGEIFFILGIATMVASFANLAHQNSIVVYVAKKIKIQSTLYFISLCSAVASSIILMIIFYRIEPGLLVLGFVINTLAIGELLGRKSFVSYSKYFLLQKILTVTLGITFFYTFGPEGILYAIAISYSGFIVQVIRGLKDSPIDFSYVKPRIEFIANNYFVGILGVLRNHIDKVIIPTILNFSVLGNFALAEQVITALMVLPAIVFKLTVPQDASGESTVKIKKFTIIASVGFTLIGVFLAPILIPIFFPSYVDAISAIQILSFSIIPTTITFMLTSKFLGLEKNRYILVGRILNLVILVPGMILLGLNYEINGIAIAWLIAHSVEMLLLSSIFLRDRFRT